MYTTERHKTEIEKQKDLADRAGRSVAQKVLSKMSLHEMLGDRKTSRKRFIALMVKEADPHFNEALSMGRDFFMEKFGA